MTAPQADLFAPRVADGTDRVARLVPLCREIAAKAGWDGVSVANLRVAAVQQGLLTGQEEGRELSYLGSVMEAAGLKKTNAFRRSGIGKSKGNLHRVFCAPEYSEGR